MCRPVAADARVDESMDVPHGRPIVANLVVIRSTDGHTGPPLHMYWGRPTPFHPSPTTHHGRRPKTVNPVTAQQNRPAISASTSQADHRAACFPVIARLSRT